jgi:hypothetical protein
MAVLGEKLRIGEYAEQHNSENRRQTAVGAGCGRLFRARYALTVRFAGC